MSAVPAAAGVLLTDAGLLMVRRGRPPAPGRWSVPGGRVEAGETDAEALVREFREETGVEVVVGPLVWSARVRVGATTYAIRDYAVRPVGGSLLEPRPGDDAAEVAWVPWERWRGLALAPGLRAMLSSLDPGALRTRSAAG